MSDDINRTIGWLANFSYDDPDAVREFLESLPQELDLKSATYYLNSKYKEQSTGVHETYGFYTPSDSYVYDEYDDDDDDWDDDPFACDCGCDY